MNKCHTSSNRNSEGPEIGDKIGASQNRNAQTIAITVVLENQIEIP